MGYTPYRLVNRMHVAFNMTATALSGTVTSGSFILDPADFDPFEDKIVFEGHGVCAGSGDTMTVTLYNVTDSKALETLTFTGNTVTKQMGKLNIPNHMKTCNVQVSFSGGALSNCTLSQASVAVVQ